jgi:carbonic anhydrase
MLFKSITLLALCHAANAADDAAYDYNNQHLWAGLDTASENQCALSKNSPIAITDEGCTDYIDYPLNNGDCTFANMEAKILPNGVQIQFEDESCTAPYFKVPNQPERYDFKQFHIHLSSEHTIDGEYFGAELHMVHLTDDENPTNLAAVVGTMIEPAKVEDNPLFTDFLNMFKDARYKVEKECDSSCRILNNYIQDNNVIAPENIAMEPYKLLSTNEFYHYDGGLTTPPCSEIVWWNLAAKPVLVSARQFAELSEIILNVPKPVNGDCSAKMNVASDAGSTSRYPTPLNGRKVQKICPKTGGGDGGSGGGDGGSGGGGNGGSGGGESSAFTASVSTGALTFAAAMVMGQLL